MDGSIFQQPRFRRQYFIKKGFQTRLTAIVILLVIIVANVTGGIVYTLLNTDTGRMGIVALFGAGSSEDLLLPSIIAAEVISIALVALVCLFVTHRMAGPVYRFEKVIEDLRKGRLDFSFRVRERDEFQELALALDAMISEYREKISRVKDEVEEARSMLSAAEAPAGSRKESASQAKTLKVLERMKDDMNFFKTSTAAEESAEV